MAAIGEEVRDFEDAKALCGGEDGLSAARGVLALLPHCMALSKVGAPSPACWLELDPSHLDRWAPARAP